MGDFVCSGQNVLDLYTEGDLGRGFRLNATNGDPRTSALFTAPSDALVRTPVLKESTTSRNISSTRDASSALGFGGSVAVTYMGIRGDGGGAFKGSSAASSTSVRVIIKRTVITEVVELPQGAAPHLSATKLTEEEVFRRYGMHFISGIHYGGSIELDITIECESKEEAKKFSASIGAEIGVAVLKLRVEGSASQETETKSSEKKVTAMAYMTGSSQSGRPSDPVQDLKSVLQALDDFQPDQPTPVGFKLERITQRQLPELSMTQLDLTRFERLTRKAIERVLEARDVLRRARDVRLAMIAGRASPVEEFRTEVFRANFQGVFELRVGEIIQMTESQIVGPLMTFLEQRPLDINASRNWPVGTTRKLRWARQVVTGLEGVGIMPNSDFLGYTLASEGAASPEEHSDVDESGEDDDAEDSDDLYFQPQYLGAGSWRGGRYKGVYLDGVPHGEGTWEASFRGDSIIDQYVGEWVNGVEHGDGVWSRTLKLDGDADRNLERYSGQWEDGQRSGQGVFTSFEGEHYDGAWLRGVKHGIGSQTTDDTLYVGEFKDGVPVAETTQLNLLALEGEAEAALLATEKLIQDIEAVRASISSAPFSDDPFFHTYFKPGFLRVAEELDQALKWRITHDLQAYLALDDEARLVGKNWPFHYAEELASVKSGLAGLRGDATLPDRKPDGSYLHKAYPDFRGFHLDVVPAFKGSASLEGGRYEGYWLDGQPHGAGVWVGGPDNQDRFEGLWHKGVRNGPGLFFPGGASEGQPRQYDGGVERGAAAGDIMQPYRVVLPEAYARVFPLRHSDQRGEQLAQEAWEEPRCVGFTADGVLVYAAQLLGAGTAAAGPKLPLMVKPQESVRAARVATLQASTGRFIGEKNERLHGRSVSAASREVFELVGVGRMVALRASSGAWVGVDRSFEPVCTARGAAPGKTELWAVEVVEGQRVGVMGHTSRQWLSLQHDGGVRGARMLRERETLTMTKVDVVLPV